MSRSKRHLLRQPVLDHPGDLGHVLGRPASPWTRLASISTVAPLVRGHPELVHRRPAAGRSSRAGPRRPSRRARTCRWRGTGSPRGCPSPRRAGRSRPGPSRRRVERRPAQPGLLGHQVEDLGEPLPSGIVTLIVSLAAGSSKQRERGGWRTSACAVGRSRAGCSATGGRRRRRRRTPWRVLTTPASARVVAIAAPEAPGLIWTTDLAGPLAGPVVRLGHGGDHAA